MVYKEDSAPQERSEEEPEQNEINIYVREETQTTEDRVSEQGFGSSKPLKEPIKRVSYLWEGALHLTDDEKRRAKSEGWTGRSSGGRKDLKELAENFSSNYLNHQNPELQRRGEASYSLRFEPPEGKVEEIERSQAGDIKVRGLTEDEQEDFLKAFKKANEEAAKAKKKQK